MRFPALPPHAVMWAIVALLARVGCSEQSQSANSLDRTETVQVTAQGPLLSISLRDTRFSQEIAAEYCAENASNQTEFQEVWRLRAISPVGDIRIPTRAHAQHTRARTRTHTTHARTHTHTHAHTVWVYGCVGGAGSRCAPTPGISAGLWHHANGYGV